MSKELVIKIISLKQEDFAKVEKALERDFNVAETSKAIFDEETMKWHIFLALFEKVKE